MLSIRLFGAPEVVRDGVVLDGAVAQRHRLALLALLMLAAPRALRRDKLVALLWPESDTARARHLLNVAVHVLRKTLGARVVLSQGDELRFNPGLVWSDVGEFAGALEHDEPERAVALYAGPLLDGFHLPDSPDFDRWAEAERMRMAHRYAQALEALAERATARGDVRSAAEWWRRLSLHDPYSGRVALRLMCALDAAGDRAGALEHARRHEALIRQELEFAPDPAVAALAERLRTEPAGEPAGDPASAGLPGVSVPGPDALRLTQSVPPSAPNPASSSRPAEIKLRLPSRRLRAWHLPILALVALVGAALSRESAGRSTVDPNVVVVAPFRVTGPDSSLSYLAEGMVDLLAATLTGEDGLRAVDPRTTMRTWRQVRVGPGDVDREEARRLARSVGAGQALLGEVVRTSDTHILISGALLGITTGKDRARARVGGALDSLPLLVDRFAIALSAERAGEGGQRLTALTSRPLPAVSAYLKGRAAYRRGQYGKAVTHLREAVEVDSAFGLAGLELASAAAWDPLGGWTILRGLEVAWRERHQLSESDRAYLSALREVIMATSASDELASWERAVRAAPERAEAWYKLGAVLLVNGQSFGMAEARDRAAAAFHRALALDPALTAPLRGLVEIAAAERDAEGVRRLGHLYLTRDSARSEQGDYVRWLIAVIAGDNATLRKQRTYFDSLNTRSLERIVWVSQAEGIALEDAERATSVLLRRAGDREARLDALFAAHQLALNRGKPSHAAQIADDILRHQGYRDVYLRRRIREALYWDADQVAGAEAASELAARADARLAESELSRLQPFARQNLLLNLADIAQWRLWHGDTTRVRRTIELVRNSQPLVRNSQPREGLSRLHGMPELLDALLASVTRSADAPALLDRLDAVARSGWGARPEETNLVVARLREQTGDIEGALRAVRRGRWSYLSTYLREEGRLAALAGDRDGAIRAYRHYLTLRTDPDPSLRGRVAQTRAALAQLEQESMGR